MMRLLCTIAVTGILALPLLAQSQRTCSGLDALTGDWIGAGAGAPGEGRGGFTFQRELQGKVLVRRNFAEYPPANGRAAYRHDDLMVIYEDATKATRADYWDNESHVIRYAVVTSPDKCTVTFESPRSSTDAAYKLTYTFKSQDEVSIGFQIAPPGKDFGTYITASAKRKK